MPNGITSTVTLTITKRAGKKKDLKGRMTLLRKRFVPAIGREAVKRGGEPAQGRERPKKEGKMVSISK